MRTEMTYSSRLVGRTEPAEPDESDTRILRTKQIKASRVERTGFLALQVEKRLAEI